MATIAELQETPRENAPGPQLKPLVGVPKPGTATDETALALLAATQEVAVRVEAVRVTTEETNAETAARVEEVRVATEATASITASTAVATQIEILGSVEGVIDPMNSTTSLLGVGGTFIGLAFDVLKYGVNVFTVRADVDSDIDGFILEWGHDGVIWDVASVLTLPANTTVSLSIINRAQFFRFRYVNGATAQTTFRVFFIHRPNGQIDGTALTDSQLRATPVPVSGVVSTGGLTDAELRATPVPVSGTVATGGLTDAELRASAVPVVGPLTDTELRASAVPVIGPLTDAELRATAVPVIGPLTDTELRASAVPVVGPLTDTELRATAVPVVGPLTDTELRATAVPVIGPLTDVELRATAVPVIGPLTDTELRATAVPVIGPLTDTELRATAVPVIGPLTDAELRATAVPVIGPLTDAELRATAVPVIGPLTDAELRASAVPVVGPLTDAELRATPVPTSVSNFPAVQPVDDNGGSLTVDNAGIFVVQPRPSTTGGLSTFHLVSAASTNATNIKASAGQVYGFSIYNNNGGALRKVVFHNTAGAPTAGVGVFFSIVIPQETTITVFSTMGIAFSAGIAITTVTGLPDSNATAVALNDLTINIWYS